MNTNLILYRLWQTLIVTIYQLWLLSNSTGATSGAGVAHPCFCRVCYSSFCFFIYHCLVCLPLVSSNSFSEGTNNLYLFLLLCNLRYVHCYKKYFLLKILFSLFLCKFHATEIMEYVSIKEANCKIIGTNNKLYKIQIKS